MKRLAIVALWLLAIGPAANTQQVTLPDLPDSPATLIETLKKTPGNAYVIGMGRLNYVKDSDLPYLASVLDSTEPCAHVVLSISSILPYTRSTVGHEAAYLIEGFWKRFYPTSLGSFQYKPDIQGMKLWYNMWSARTAQRSTEESLRTFAASVARDVTREGPAAWRRYFSDDPGFFMASSGALVFSSGEAATAGTRQLEKTVRHIELQWGEPMRIDVLAPDLAVLAMPWTEVREDAEGHRVKETGYFTGLAEMHDGGWRFRNAHWSVPAPSSAIK